MARDGWIYVGVWTVIALAGTLIALGVTSARADDWNLIDLIHRLNHLFVAPLGVIMLLAILRPRVGLTRHQDRYAEYSAHAPNAPASSRRLWPSAGPFDRPACSRSK